MLVHAGEAPPPCCLTATPPPMFLSQIGHWRQDIEKQSASIIQALIRPSHDRLTSRTSVRKAQQRCVVSVARLNAIHSCQESWKSTGNCLTILRGYDQLPAGCGYGISELRLRFFCFILKIRDTCYLHYFCLSVVYTGLSREQRGLGRLKLA